MSDIQVILPSNWKESVDIFDIKVGDKLVYNIPNGGWGGEAEDVANKLVFNEGYTIKRIDIGGCRTDIEFEEVEGEFNSVFFQKATK